MMEWHCCIVGINQEFLAKFGLDAKGFETYCPIGQKMTRHGRQKIIKRFPVFSRYLFVKFDRNDPHYARPIRSTDGVINIITNDWQPVSIEPWVIEDIQQREIAGEFDNLEPEKSKQPKWAKSFEVLKNLLNVEIAA